MNFKFVLLPFLVSTQLLSGQENPLMEKVSFTLHSNLLPEISVDFNSFINIYESVTCDPDTLIHVTNAENYSIIWFITDQENFVELSEPFVIDRDTVVCFMITYNNACTYIDSIKFNYLVTNVELPESDISGAIHTYPNPAHSTITVVLENLHGYFTVRLVNPLGADLYNVTAQCSDETLEILLDIGNLEPGIYMIVVSNADFIYSYKVQIN